MQGQERRVMRGHAGTLVCLILLVGLLLVVFGPLTVVAPPPIAMRTQGRALDQSGSPLPLGTPIRTYADGAEYSNGSRVQHAAGPFAVATEANSKTNANVSGTSPSPRAA